MILSRFRPLFRHPVVKADVEAILFSAKTFAAAILAYAIALRIGLPRPAWAIVTVYLVSQPSAGAAFGRGLYRMAGTLVGAAATVAIVPTFANDPVLCSMVLAGWIGFCLFLSLLDRTPRAYAFVLSGYTASLIGFPAVGAPGAIFETATVRVQEIGLGIMCAVLVHRYVLPRPMTGPFKARLAATVFTAKRLAADALHDAPESRRRDDRHRLALDLLALRGLATHLPYDPVASRPAAATLRKLHERLAALLPCLADIEARLDAVRCCRQEMPAELARLLLEVRDWIASETPVDQERSALRLVHDARGLAQGGSATLKDGLSANTAGHLAELVGLLHACDRLGHDAAAGESRCRGKPFFANTRATGYVFHRDPVAAARVAAGAALGILAGCLLWIWSAWPDGGLAVSVLGVTCALFGNVDAPVPNVWKYLVGSIWGVSISLFYSFVILPRVPDFTTLVAVLAPAFLLAGSLQARPATAFMALGIALTIPILTGLDNSYVGDFGDALNSGIALFVGIGFSAVSMALLQTIAPDAAIDRVLRLGRRDVARRARGGGPAEPVWTGLMIDRMALLLPRLALSSRSATETLDETLRQLHVGHAAARLRHRVKRQAGPGAEAARCLLADLAVRFGRAGRPAPGELSERVEALIARIADGADGNGPLLDPLIDLRFALSPARVGEGGA